MSLTPAPQLARHRAAHPTALLARPAPPTMAHHRHPDGPSTRQGWTLVELAAALTVMLLLALALPGVSGKALPGPEDALRGYAGAAASAMAINHAACQMQAMNGTFSAMGPCEPVDSCADVLTIAAIELPAEIEVIDTAIGPPGQWGAETVCTLREAGTRMPTASFVGISAGRR